MKLLHNILRGSTLATALFIFQACYGMPPSDFENRAFYEATIKVTDSDGTPMQGVQLFAKNAEMAEVAAKTTGTCYWMLDLTNTQPALFRIYERNGNQNNATYVDDFTLYYTGIEGGPIDFIQGDVNDDHEVNIADINAVLDVIMNGTADADLTKRADVNVDGEINIADVNMVINIILK